MQTKITHLTSAHGRYDTRIFLKMYSSLAKNENYDVSLVVIDGKSDETKNDVNIIYVGAKTGIVTFHPLPNHIDTKPNKMFEYMSTGLPIITSTFPYC